ncbi:MAG: hypothetical protein U9N85_01880 [Bacteroidota bacterium]|nr:hypothetical protein [Bacteroidota bacterium]
MKAKLTFLSLLILIASIANSQTVNEEEPICYTDTNKKFFINKNLPLYIWVSVSPDEGSKKYRLYSEKSAKYSNPMYLDTEGRNTLNSPWAIDPETKKYKYPKEEITFELYNDGVSPSTKLYLTGAPKYIKSGTLYYGKDLKLKLKSSDAVSGVKQTLLSVNGAAYTEYTSTVAMDKEGNTALKYYSSDKVGNIEGSHSKNFVVDISAPEMEYSVEGPGKGNIYGPKAKVVLKSTDELSGVKAQYYEIDGVKRLYSYPIPASYFKSDGAHKILVYSVDNVNNSNKDKNSKSDEFNLDLEYDKTDPEVSAEVVGDQYKGKYLYVSERSKIKLTAEDKSGVKEITYGISSKTDNTYSQPFLLNEDAGIQKVYYKAEDDVDNVSYIHSKVVYYDNKKPISWISYSTPKFFNRDTLFINSETDVELYSKDSYSGTKITEYSVDDKSSFNKYEGKFKISNDGFHTIYFKTTDNVNNVEDVKESECLVDNTAPEIYVNFSINSIRKETKDGKTLNVYPKYTKVYIAATDKWSGTSRIYYSVNGSRNARYTSAQAFQNRHLIDKEGEYSLKITANDKLGNTKKYTENFIISEE